MYKVINEFVDLQDKVNDKYHEYAIGDVYPRKGYTPSQSRIEELLSDDNKLRIPLIEAVDGSPSEKVDEEVKEGAEDAGKNQKDSKPSGKSRGK